MAAGQRPWAHPRSSPERDAVVLCVAEDPAARARLVELCRSAGVPARSEPPSPPPPSWDGAAAVLVGTAGEGRGGPGGSGGPGGPDEPGGLGGLTGMPRRPGVLVVHESPPGDDGEPPPAVWRAALALGAEHVAVLPTARAWLLQRLQRAARPRARCVAVVGARGGAGASSTAVALATEAVRAGRADPPRVLLLDADPGGGGLDLALGAEELPGLRWPDLGDVEGPLPCGGLSTALPDVDGVRLLSHGRAGHRTEPVSAGAVAAVWEAARRDHDLVVVDLPRSPCTATVPVARGPSPRAAAATEVRPPAGAGPDGTDGPDVLLLVCPAEVRAAAAAPAVLRAWLGWRPAELHVLVRGPSPGGLRAADAVVALRAGAERLGGAGAAPLTRADVVRAEAGIAAALDGGAPFAESARSPLRRWAELWLDDLTAVPPGPTGAA
ncbi:septum site-determining protein Ssd [Aquipuribacter sp. SD81]|uniref:septum site-determining protein Ssd n=1 Tax=Aquipuribacter sp. SD81 TaxID=3127703 RepID=UPI00301605B0